MNNDNILKLLQKLHKMRHKPDLHSFKAKIKSGVVFVEAEEDAIFMEIFIYDADGHENRERWVGAITEAATKLERLEIDPATVET